MDKRNSKNSKKKGSRNKLEAMHLLPEIDVKSVKNYVHELLRRYHIKLSELTSECLICTSSLFKNWQDTKQHLKNPSHINNITRDNKQFTAICILCNYILIADDADYIFEHFILHKAAKGQIGKEVLHEPFENDPNSSSSSISSSTLIYKDNVNIHTNSSNQKYTFQKEKECLDDVEDTFRSNEGIAEERHESSLKKINMNPDVKHFESSSAMKKNLEVNTDNDHGISRTPKLGVNCIKTSNDTESVTTSQKCIYSSSTGVSPFQKDIDNHVSDKVISSHNFVSESSNEFFYPKLAFFSNKTLQLISPGVSEEEFTFSQEMNAVNIRQYCVKMYYSEYYALRKIYFSCLECNVLRLRENYFFKHLTRIKHSHNLGDGYDICFIKICDICQVLLLGHMDRIKEHFQCHAHKQSVKCKLGLIKQQYAVISGKQKLGFSGMLTDRCTHFFSSKEALNSSVESSLKEAREVASLANQLSRILERDIKNTLKEKYSDFHVEVVGSRLYELANHQSDVDIHLNIGNHCLSMDSI